MDAKLDFRKEEALERLGDDEDLLRMLIETFLTEWPSYLQALKDAMGQPTALDLKKAAHRVKGASSTIGVEGLRSLAKKIEENCAANTESISPEANQMANELIALLELAKPEMEAWLVA